MSDIDDLDDDQLSGYSGLDDAIDGGSDETNYHVLGTPPTSIPPVIRSHPKDAIRQHRRSVSEQIFSVPGFHALAARTNQRKTDFSGGATGGDRFYYHHHQQSDRGSVSNYSVGWETAPNMHHTNGFNDYSPYATGSSETLGGVPRRRASSAHHFKEFCKRTYNKAKNNGRPDGEDTAYCPSNQSLTVASDSRQRYRKNSSTEKRRRPYAFFEEHGETMSKSDGDSIGSQTSSSGHRNGADEAQRRQSRIRNSLADMFARIKRSVSQHMPDEDTRRQSWNITLVLRSATLKEKIPCYMNIGLGDRIIKRSKVADESNNPRWNERFEFKLSQLDENLELQLIRKHSLRTDKLIGRAHIRLDQIELECSLEQNIKGYDTRKGNQILGTVRVDINIDSSFTDLLDDGSFLESFYGSSSGSPVGDLNSQMTNPTTVTDDTVSSSSRIHFRRKDMRRRIGHHLKRIHRHRSRSHLHQQSSTETLCEQFIREDGAFFFRPYETTKVCLKRETPEVLPAGITWRPFSDWPGDRTNIPPLVAIQRRSPARFCELRIPKLPWPIEFLLPMTRLSFPPSKLAESFDSSDTCQKRVIVQSGVVLVHLIGARSLRAMPQVEMVASSCGFDEKVSGSGGAASILGTTEESPSGSLEGRSSMIGAASGIGGVGGGGGGGLGATKSVAASSPETRAASLVALHWAAKSLTVPPSPQVVLEYGSEKRESSNPKNTSNPDFLDEFEFPLTNGSPRCIKLTVYDRETQTGSGGVPRSHILGETRIDLSGMPLEMTQQIELQLLKNSNEARLLLLVTITGLKTGADLPPTCPTRRQLETGSVISVGRSMSNTSGAYLTERGFEQRDNVRLSPPSISNDITTTTSATTATGTPTAPEDVIIEKEDKPSYTNLPSHYLKMVAEHFNAKNSFKNPRDIGWMRVRICSAMGLGGKASSNRVETYCEIDFINTRLRTHSVVKGKDPTWNRCFVIPLSDIHGIMQITVVEIEKSRTEVLARLAIHPLRVENGGTKWYALKTPDKRSPTKGSLLLEITVYFNQFKAAVNTFCPKETRYRNLAKKQKLLQRRFEHVKPLMELIRWWNRLLDDWWLWKNPLHSILGLIGYQLLVYYFKPYFIPLYMVLVLLKNRIYSRGGLDAIIHGLKNSKTTGQLASPQEHEIYKRQCEMLEQIMMNGGDTGASTKDANSDRSSCTMNNRDRHWEIDALGNAATPGIYGVVSGAIGVESQNMRELDFYNSYNLALPEISNDQPLEEEEKGLSIVKEKADGKKSMRTRLSGYKETTTRILEIVENTASFYERMEGLFNWRIPWVSGLAVLVLLFLTILLFIVPLKVVFMIWGLNKFTKAILRPNALRHNEFADLLSRVPNLIESVELAEYRPDAFTITPKGKGNKS